MNKLKYPLVCFDLDGTLVDDTVYIWKTLHETIGTDPEARTKAYNDFFSGTITYEQWFNNDLTLLSKAGATESRFKQILKTLKPMSGSHRLLNSLRNRGHKIAIVSGSLNIVVESIFPDTKFDHVLLNKISFKKDGQIQGGVHTPYDLEGKAEGLKELCRLEGISTHATAFIGDNENDVWIAKEAGLAIAFNCKSDKLRQCCDVEVKKENIQSIFELTAGNASIRDK